MISTGRGVVDRRLMWSTARSGRVQYHVLQRARRGGGCLLGQRVFRLPEVCRWRRRRGKTAVPLRLLQLFQLPLQTADRQLQPFDALAQRVFKVHLAAHRPLGYRRHLFFQTGCGGDFVDALDGNQRAVHIADNQPQIGKGGIGQQRVFGTRRIQFGGHFRGNGGICGYGKAQAAA